MYSEDNKWIQELTRVAEESDSSWYTAFTLSLLFGFLGLDRFYLNQIGRGLLKFLSFGGLGIWWIIDLVLLLTNRMRDADGGLVRRPF